MSLADRKRSERNKRERRQQRVRAAVARRVLLGEFDDILLEHGSDVGMGTVRWRCRKLSNTAARQVARLFVYNAPYSEIAKWIGYDAQTQQEIGPWYHSRLATLNHFIDWITAKRATYHGKRALAASKSFQPVQWGSDEQ